MIDVSYENLFRTIQPSLPINWQKVVIHAAFSEDSCAIKYYIKQDGSFRDCFSIEYDQAKVLEIIANLHQNIAAVRNSLTEENKWNSITVVIMADGSFHSDFDYAEVNWNSAETAKAWADTYLNN